MQHNGKRPGSGDFQVFILLNQHRAPAQPISELTTSTVRDRELRVELPHSFAARRIEISSAYRLFTLISRSGLTINFTLSTHDL